MPASVEDCYEGPAATQGVGVCVGGQRVCLDDGSGFGPCQGQVLPGVEDCATPIDEDCTAGTCPVKLEWATIVGGPHAHAWSVAADAAGNVVVAGRYEGSPIDFGGGALPTSGGMDAFVVKLDPAGNHLWSRRVSNMGLAYASRVTVDAAGAVIVAGETGASGDLQLDGVSLGGTGQGFVLKLDAGGELVFCRRINGGDNQNRFGLATLPAGDVVVAGTFDGTLEIDGVQGSSFPDFYTDGYVMRLDGDSGAVVWAAPWSNPGEQYVDSLAIDASGAIFVAGRSWASPIALGGAPVGAGGQVLFVARYDESGAHVWSESISTDAAHPVDIGATDAGEVGLAGATSEAFDFGSGPIGGSDDAFLVKLSAGGAHLWGRDFSPTTADSRASAVAMEPLGNSAIGGVFEKTIDFGVGPLTSGTIAGGKAGFVAKLDPDGNAIWSAMLGSSNFAVVSGLAITPSGHVIAVGYFGSGLDFWGQATFTASSGLFIAKLGP
jgi:hypothetical protein